MTLPSETGGATTEEVGYFEGASRSLAEWLVVGLDGSWCVRPAGLSSMSEAVALLEGGNERDHYLWVPVGHWSVLLTSGLAGTDVGVLPSLAARKLGCRAMRVVVTSDETLYPARILEVFGPGGAPPLALERSIVAANDGGRWVFETSGSPYAFEDLSVYKRRVKARRFTAEMVFSYQALLGVPVDQEVDWMNAWLVEPPAQSEQAPTLA